MSNKKIVKIDGKEIEIPEGFELVVDKNGNIRIVEANKEVQSASIVGTDIPEYTLSELKSVDLPVEESKLKENVAKVERVEYYKDLLLDFILFGVLALFGYLWFFKSVYCAFINSDACYGHIGLTHIIIGVVLSAIGTYRLWLTWKYTEPLLLKKKEKEQ